MIEYEIMSEDIFAQAITRLQTELNKVGAIKVNLQAQSLSPYEEAKRLVFHDQTLRQAIDDSCRQWVADSTWPAMDEECAKLILERLNQAYLLGVFLHHKGHLRAEQQSVNELLIFLLIDMWETVGVHRVRSRLFRTQ